MRALQRACAAAEAQPLERRQAEDDKAKKALEKQVEDLLTEKAEWAETRRQLADQLGEAAAARDDFCEQLEYADDRAEEMQQQIDWYRERAAAFQDGP